LGWNPFDCGWLFTAGSSAAAHRFLCLTKHLPTTPTRRTLDVTPSSIVFALVGENCRREPSRQAVAVEQNDHTDPPVNKGKPARFRYDAVAGSDLHPIRSRSFHGSDASLGPPYLKLQPGFRVLRRSPGSRSGDSLGHGTARSQFRYKRGGPGSRERRGNGEVCFAHAERRGLPTCSTPTPPYPTKHLKHNIPAVVLVGSGPSPVDGRATIPGGSRAPVVASRKPQQIQCARWRCKPVTGPNGKPVPVWSPFEVPPLY